MTRTRRLSPQLEVKPYNAPSGGWGSVRSLAKSLTQNLVPIRGPRVLPNQNKPDGFMCVSCAWAKPADPRIFEFCENGAKATTWEITHKRVTPEFFASHTVTALERWDDHQLEDAGRLTHPMRYDAASDKYVPIAWEDAFAEIGRELRALEPVSAVFYTSGRASLETAFMYGLLAQARATLSLCRKPDLEMPHVDGESAPHPQPHQTGISPQDPAGASCGCMSRCCAADKFGSRARDAAEARATIRGDRAS